jgi:hypothetical protein
MVLSRRSRSSCPKPNSLTGFTGSTGLNLLGSDRTGRPVHFASPVHSDRPVESIWCARCAGPNWSFLPNRPILSAQARPWERLRSSVQPSPHGLKSMPRAKIKQFAKSRWRSFGKSVLSWTTDHGPRTTALSERQLAIGRFLPRRVKWVIRDIPVHTKLI